MKNLKEIKGDASFRRFFRKGNKNSSLIIIAPLPQHPSFTPELCSREWFRPSFSILCQKTEKSFLERQRKHIVDKLELASKEKSNLHVFDPFEHFCDVEYCYAWKEGNFLYLDKDHLSKEGALMISQDLLLLIRSTNSQTSNPLKDNR